LLPMYLIENWIMYLHKCFLPNGFLLPIMTLIELKMKTKLFTLVLILGLTQVVAQPETITITDQALFGQNGLAYNLKSKKSSITITLVNHSQDTILLPEIMSNWFRENPQKHHDYWISQDTLILLLMEEPISIYYEKPLSDDFKISVDGERMKATILPGDDYTFKLRFKLESPKRVKSVQYLKIESNYPIPPLTKLKTIKVSRKESPAY
jgi:hypothetical protein